MAASASIFLLLVFLPMLMMLAVGLFLIIASRRGSGGRGYPACGACGYNLSASVGAVPRCPECGADFKIVGITPPGGRRSKPMLITGILLLILPVTCAGGIGVMALARAVRSAATPVLAAPVPAAPPTSTVPVAPPSDPLTPVPQPTVDAEIETTG